MEPAEVTIVSVTRNDLAGIQSTAASVRSQRGVSIQHIVVDGASTDGTFEWLASLEWSEGSHFISEPDQGIYDAMNKGAALATGSLLLFMNGGDRFPHETTASYVVDDWKQHSWKWAYGVTVLAHADGSVSRIHQLAPFSKTRLGLGLAAVPHQSLWMTTDLFRDIDGFRVGSGVSADMDLCWKACLRSEPRLLPEILCIAEEGGVSADQAPGYYARAMRKNVKHYGSSVLGSKVADPIASAAVVALTGTVQIVPTLWTRFRKH